MSGVAGQGGAGEALLGWSRQEGSCWTAAEPRRPWPHRNVIRPWSAELTLPAVQRGDSRAEKGAGASGTTCRGPAKPAAREEQHLRPTSQRKSCQITEAKGEGRPIARGSHMRRPRPRHTAKEIHLRPLAHLATVAFPTPALRGLPATLQPHQWAPTDGQPVSSPVSSRLRALRSFSKTQLHRI